MRRAWCAGDDGEAERIGASDDAPLLRGALAIAAAMRDEDARALALVDRLPADLGAVAYVVRAHLAERAGQPAPDEADVAAEGVIADEVMLARAGVHRAAGRSTMATSLLEGVLRSNDPTSRALASVGLGETAFAEGDLGRASDHLLGGLEALSSLGLRRAAGRAMLKHALLVAPHLGREPPAVWLSRAKAELGPALTFRDRAMLRSGFRAHGRRLPDASLSGRALEAAHAIERAAVDLRALGLGGAGFDALDEAVRRAEGATEEMLEITTSSLVEQSRTRGIARSLAGLDGITDVPSFARGATEVLLSALSADAVALLATPRGAPITLLGSAGSCPSFEEVRSAVLPTVLGQSTPPPSEGDPRARAESKPLGPVLVVPVRGAAFQGVLYADKRARAGQFAETDAHLASLAAELLAQGLARLFAGAAEHTAFAQLGATLEAIRDGVVSLDQRGVIVRVNQAGARMLRLRQEDLVGKGASDLPDVAPLFHQLAKESRVDGAVVRLAHGSIVVTARPILSESGDPRGIVATLVELDRAQRIAARITQARPRYGFHDVVGEAPAVLEVKRLARQAATVDASVLITGESGTGKEVLAQSIHTGGSRANEPFIGINCAALPRELLEAELFGYERGAFTGARSEGVVGKLELAGEGTLLLDEIGDMPLDMQAKLLRVLQERSVVRLGGATERPISARVIATTHRDLDSAVDRGTFRLDLLYRLRVLAIHLPPLRERPEDIPAIARTLLRRVARGQGKAVSDLSPDVIETLTAYPWPGNVRELGNVVEREVSLLDPETLVLSRLSAHPSAANRSAWSGESPSSVRSAPLSSSPLSSQPSKPSPESVKTLVEVERQAVVDALKAFGGNVTRAAKALGISRATFYVKLREAGVHPEEDPGPETLRSIRRVERKE